MQKARPNEPGFFLDAYATLHDGYSTLYATLYADSELLRLRHQGLERLVGLLGEIGIEFADLGGLGYEALIGGLGVFGLHLDRLLERLDAEQLFQRRGAVFESLLRVVGDLDRDGLSALRQHAHRLQRDIDALFPDLLEVVEILD